MSKFISFKNGLSSVLVWSVISAAFIGPGTVTTCAKAGAQYGTQLIWALVFSTIATIILQELVARVSMATGKNIGDILSIKYQSNHSLNISKLLFFAIAFGCAAYESGNILGAVSGLRLIYPLPTAVYTLIIVTLCYFLLSRGSISQVSKIMGVVVFIMGLLFCYLAMTSSIDIKEILAGLQPRIPTSGGSLIIALIGTTIVPYNLFLASGLKFDQSIFQMRLGLVLAIGLGGLISIAILLSSVSVHGTFSYQSMYEAIEHKAGTTGANFFAFGLFAAGFSSSITAPLAAAVCGKSLFVNSVVKSKNNDANIYKYTWITILSIGALFGLLQIKPIPAIIAAQGINGLLLPLVCIALYLAVHDQNLLSRAYRHHPRWNYVYLFIIWIITMLGIYNVQHAILNMFAIKSFQESRIILLSVLLSLALTIILQQDHRTQSHQKNNN
ncbi:MAG: Nramp family divalent metal transporter [Saprospiraceae bacterium]|nr:Nramp family divalent metal transporter [Saprospiraceae bacterium]